MYKNIILGLGLLFTNYTYGSSSKAEQTFVERHSTAILGVSALAVGAAGLLALREIKKLKENVRHLSTKQTEYDDYMQRVQQCIDKANSKPIRQIYYNSMRSMQSYDEEGRAVPNGPVNATASELLRQCMTRGHPFFPRTLIHVEKALQQ